ncbi:hypothetical protein [Lacimonas salitolerans]|uniref:DsrE/DsrF-like family protein n=1 Tax=Lacimonas salitolerans TaxID=1323750 RepID=A0ABW4EEL5_9RHOB
MKRFLTAAAIATATLTAPMAHAEGPSKLVTVLTAPEAQTQLMAMVLTMQAVEQGKSAHILLCGPAGDLALKDAPETATAGQPPRDMSPQGLMQMIMTKPDTTVEVCAIYLPGKGADASVLLDGVGVAKPDAMAATIMGDDTQVMGF